MNKLRKGLLILLGTAVLTLLAFGTIWVIDVDDTLYKIDNNTVQLAMQNLEDHLNTLDLYKRVNHNEQVLQNLLDGNKELPDTFGEMDALYRDLLAPTVRVRHPSGKRGSGVVIYSRPNELGTGYDSYVLTCNHIVRHDIRNVDEVPEVSCVELFDYHTGKVRKVLARVVATSITHHFGSDEEGEWQYIGPGEDLALLRLETVEPLPAVKILPKEKIKQLKIFDGVYAVGCALGSKTIPTQGQITRLEEGFTMISANIVWGNSGGACFLQDTHEFIGVVNAGRVAHGQFMTHMGLVRPVHRVYNWLSEMGYGFIYDKNVSDDDRFEKIREENDAVKFALRAELQQHKNRLAMLETIVDKLYKDNECLKEDNSTLMDMLHEEHSRIEELEERIDKLEELLSKITTAVQTCAIHIFGS